MEPNTEDCMARKPDAETAPSTAAEVLKELAWSGIEAFTAPRSHKKGAETDFSHNATLLWVGVGDGGALEVVFEESEGKERGVMCLLRLQPGVLATWPNALLEQKDREIAELKKKIPEDTLD